MESIPLRCLNPLRRFLRRQPLLISGLAAALSTCKTLAIIMDERSFSSNANRPPSKGSSYSNKS